MSTHNICFCGEIRKILCGHPKHNDLKLPTISHIIKTFENVQNVQIQIILHHCSPFIHSVVSNDSFSRERRP